MGYLVTQGNFSGYHNVQRDTLAYDVRTELQWKQSYVMVANCTVSYIAFVSACGSNPRTMKIVLVLLCDDNGFPDCGCLRHIRSLCARTESRQIKTVVSEVPQPYEKLKWYRRSLSEIPEEDITLCRGLPL